MMPPRARWAACAALLFAAAPAAADAPRYKFKEGDTAKYVITERGAMEMDLGLGAMKFVSDVKLDLTWKVTKTGKDGKFTITQAVDRVRVDIDTPGGKIKYDSKGQPPDDSLGKMAAEVFGVFPGNDMTLVLDPRGNVESLKYSAKLAAALRKLPPQAAQAAVSLSEDSVRRMIGQCVPVLPPKEFAKGDSWKSGLKAKFAGSVNFSLDNKNTYEGEVTRGGRKLQKIVTKSKLAVAADPAASGSIEVKSQDVGSTSYFDRAAGRFAEGSYSQKIEMEVKENGKTITIKGTTVTTLKLAGKEK
jgi:hypothetical protein